MSKPEERFKAPPILPPHLLQVILNKDTGISVSAQASAWTTLHSHVQLPFLSASCRAAGGQAQRRPSVSIARSTAAMGTGCWQGVLSVCGLPIQQSLSDFLAFHSLLNFMTQCINQPFSVSYIMECLLWPPNFRL